jgi:alkylation response protein AidB-like acyl-CoA dehydrogenase
MFFDGFSIQPEAFIGISDDYTREPAFSAGAWRTSAVTVGGLEALVGEAMAQLVARGRDRNPHQQSRMGRAIIAQETARLWCSRAAVVAEDLGVDARQKTAYVNLARIAIESATLEALRLVQRSIGLVGFLEPNPIERLMRDLATYLRQPAADEALTEAAGWYLKHGNLQKPES